ncbi:Protein phosphatase 1 [Rhodotorula toruloides]|nr:Protein phosphatase 1 [Rhodotorula toruloides]
MPYATPSPSTSPVSTMTLPAAPPLSLPPMPSPRLDQKRPTRHHHRSHSSEPVASTSNFIFVQPATPDSAAKGAERRGYFWAHSNGGGGGSPGEGGSGSSSPSFNTVPRRQGRIRLAALTPATTTAGSPGPSSQEEGSSAAEDGGASARVAAARSPGSNPTVLPKVSGSTAGGIFQNAYPFGETTRGRSTSSASASDSALASGDEISTPKPAPMLRKKSGELVRPSLKADTMRRDFSKPRSAPATPVCPKYVHFDTQLEHVKHFLAQQRPAAVSRSGSPVETETEDEPEAFPFPAMATPQAGTVKLVLPNFPSAIARAQAQRDKDVFVDSLEMTPDGRSIRGLVRVKNLAFEKWVAVRFTLDNWQTVSEVSADYVDSLPGADRFSFTIRLQDLLARLEEKTMFLAVRYTVGGKEIWDNNGGQNYRIEFRKVPPSSGAAQRAAVSAAQQQRKAAWSVTNAGQAADRMADLRRELDRLVREDNFDDDDANASTGDSSVTAGLGLSSASSGRSLRLGYDSRSFSDSVSASLSGRYDFGNSLKMYNGGATAATATGPPQKGTSSLRERVGANSPRFVDGLPHPAASQPFFDPVSTSPQRPRAPPLPVPSSPPQTSSAPYSTQIINGHPATVFEPSIPAPINSHRSDSPEVYSPRTQQQLQPDFGLPSTSLKPLQTSMAMASTSGTSTAYFSPTLPNATPRPHSPQQDSGLPPSYFYPPGSNVGGLPYLPLQDATTHGYSSGLGTSTTTSRVRYNTHPAGSSGPAAMQGPISPRTSTYSPLVPPAFREHRSRLSPFSSPAPSPPNGMSPSASPPASTSPLPATRKLRSPPPERADDSDDAGSSQMWSPATTDSSTISSVSSGSSLLSDHSGRIHPRREDSESSTSSLLSSPESDATSVAPDSPSFVPGQGPTKGPMNRPNSALEFSNFLDRYRFHLGSSTTSSNTSSLGLSGSSSPTTDFFNFTSAAVPIPGTMTPTSSSDAGSGSNSPTPKHLSPLAVAVAAAATSPGVVTPTMTSHQMVS